MRLQVPLFFLLTFLQSAAVFAGAHANRVQSFHWEGGKTPDGRSCSANYDIKTTWALGIDGHKEVRSDEICNFELVVDGPEPDLKQHLVNGMIQHCEAVGQVPFLGAFSASWYGANSPAVRLRLDRGLFSSSLELERDFEQSGASSKIECSGLQRASGDPGASLLGSLLRKFFRPEADLGNSPALVQTRAPAKVEGGDADPAYQNFDRGVAEQLEVRSAKNSSADATTAH
jgi:hypothetical protein